MQEKIGNITLDYTYYPGEDLYSDGPIEDEMVEIAKKYGEAELNQVIVERNSWPILYHFSHIRQNIASWLPITKEDDVLEIGSGCGAVTGAWAELAKSVTCIDLSKKRSHVNAFRNQKYENIEIMVGNFQDIEKNLPKQYDYITLIGVFEYSEGYIGGSNPYVEMLKRIEKHLKPGGKVVIAIENRLGLKYWAGCTEDHVGKYFEGLENYPDTKGVKTFSRKEWMNIIEEAGSYLVNWYYPYPDYKFPMEIYSDEYLPKAGQLISNNNNFDRERVKLFEESKVFDSLIQNDLFPEFSNSFLLILEKEDPEEKILFSKFSNERSRETSIRTEVLKIKDGTLKVRKTPVYSEGTEHVGFIPVWQEKLDDLYADSSLQFNRCTKQGNHVLFEYVDGDNLENVLDQLILDQKEEEASQMLKRYLKELRRVQEQQPFELTKSFTDIFGKVQLPEGLKAASVTDLDMLCSNILLGDQKTVIDYEWTFDFPIPSDFVIYRVIYYYVEKNPLRASLMKEDLYDYMGIGQKEKEIYFQMEESFQRYITGGIVPMREMYHDMTPGAYRIQELLQGQTEELARLKNQTAYQEELIYQMEHTKVWKFYQKYRKLIKK